MQIPRFFGESKDTDTQFIAFVKANDLLVMLFISFIGLILVGFIVSSLLNQKPTGTWRYALCKVFLEQNTQYPPDLKILTAAEKQNSAQIGYLTTNSYGSRESQLMECFYNTADNKVELSRVTIDRKTYDQSKVTTFNLSINVILANDNLDLELPMNLPQSIEDLKFE